MATIVLPRWRAVITVSARHTFGRQRPGAVEQRLAAGAYQNPAVGQDGSEAARAAADRDELELDHGRPGHSVTSTVRDPVVH